LSEEHARETARLLNEVRPDFIRVRTFALHPQSPVKKMVDAGTFLPMTDEEIIAEIRLLVSCFDEIHSYFSSGDYSPNLLMQVNGYLDQQKAGMLSEIDTFLSLWIAYNPLGRRPVRRCHAIAIARRNCRYRADIENMESAPCHFSDTLWYRLGAVN